MECELHHPLAKKLFELLEIHPDDLDQSIPHDQDLEGQLLRCITDLEIEELGFANEDFPNIYRKLPRLFYKHDPTFSKVKGNFNSLEMLKQCYIDKALQKAYSHANINTNVKFVIFTWVMDDGWGDLYAQLETARIVKKSHPLLHIDLVSLVHKDRKKPLSISEFQINWLHYSADFLWDEPSIEVLEILSQASAIIQIPTSFPTSTALPEWFADALSDKCELIGEYGLIDRAWYHPKKARAMGLHFLEKGIFIKDMPPSDFRRLENKTILRILFGKDSPSDEEIADYKSTHRFNLNYTKSTRGYYLYLYTLLQSLIEDEKTIDICFTDMNILIDVFEKDSFFPQFNIKNVLIYHRESIAEMTIFNAGKTLRLIHIEDLCHDDFLVLVSSTDDLVGCTGDGSISEAISADKVFFYDPPYHKRSFLKDLIALADRCIPDHPHCIEFLQLCLTPPDRSLEDVYGDWTTEDYIQPESMLNLCELGAKLGQLLKHPEFHVGIKKLNETIREKYSFNVFLSHFVRRIAVHHLNPEIAEKEETILNDFYKGEKSCKDAFEEIRELLSGK